MLSAFLLSFIPVFVAMDVVGTIPLYLNLTRRLSLPQRQLLIRQALFTALALGVLVLVGGKSLFNFLGITIADFQVAGGLILLVISIRDLVSPTDHESKIPLDPMELGVVPLGIPLILGPAVLTTLLILVDTQGYAITLLSLSLNLLLAYGAFHFAPWFERAIGRNGASAIGKVASLFLAAIAVMMVRRGVFEWAVHR